MLDDAALLDGLVLTHDSIAEGVHFFPDDPPASVGWKLVAVNLSDLAAKGAEPLAALLSLTLAGDGEWEARFLDGIEAACETYGLPLVGGDTIALAGRSAAGARADRDRTRRRRTPARSGGQTGDRLVAGRDARRFGGGAGRTARRIPRRPGRWSISIAGPFRCSQRARRLPATPTR